MAAEISFFHFALSASIWSTSSSAQRGLSRTPRLRILPIIGSQPRPATIAFDRSRTSVRRVPAGAATYHQSVALKSPHPYSLTVGMSGAANQRSDELTARARSAPDRMYVR